MGRKYNLHTSTATYRALLSSIRLRTVVPFVRSTMSIPQHIHQVPHYDQIQADLSSAESPYPQSFRRGSRQTHASGINSWHSFGFPQSANSSRPLPMPIQRARGPSTSSQWHEPTHEYTADSAVIERVTQSGYLEEQRGEEDEGYGEEEYEEGVTDPSTEHMTFEDVPEMPEAGPRRRGAKAFVGGFVSGIRHLPRLMVRTDHKTLKRGAPEAYATQDPEALPAYEEAGQPVAGPSNVQYVEALEMPGGQLASSPLSEGSNGGAQESQSPPEHRNVEHAQAMPRSAMFTPPAHTALALPPPIVATPPPVGSPVLVEPRPTRDYAKMDSPVRTAPPDDSFGAHITRIHNFFVELKNLPWVSARATDDYYPEKSHRARDPKIKPGSWYSTRQHHEIDLLATPAALKHTAEVARSEDDNSLVRPRRTPTATSTCSSQVYSATRHYAASIAHGSIPSPVASLRRHSRRASSRSYHVGGFHLPHVPTIASMSMSNGITMGVDPDGRPVYMIPVIPSTSSPPHTSQAPSHAPTNVPYPGSSPSNAGDQSRRLSVQP